MAEPHRGSLDQSEEQQEVLIPYRHHGLPTHRKLHSEGVWQQISNRKLINKMEVVTDVRPAVQHLVREWEGQLGCVSELVTYVYIQ